MTYLRNNPGEVWQLTVQHMHLVAITMVVAILIGIPLGIVVSRVRWLEAPVLGAAGALYTVPSLALFAVLIPFTGLGDRAAIPALVMYSLLIIIRNTVAGIDSVDRATMASAKGMGMTDIQRLYLVDLPLGLPVILAGIRIATVSTIGITTVAAYIGSGGLGTLIFTGLALFDTDRIVAGALATSILALLADWGLGRLGTLMRRDLRRA